MATYADNDIFLKMGTTEVQAYFRNVQLSLSNSPVDTTAGAGSNWTERAPGLNDASISISLVYDAADLQTYIQKIAQGQTITIEYGPEGSVSGKPRHVQDFVISQNQHSTNVDKSVVEFSITGDAAAAPSVDMSAGGVFS